MTMFLCRVDGRNGICVGYGPGRRAALLQKEGGAKSAAPSLDLEFCVMAIVIFGPKKGDVRAVPLTDIEATNLPKKLIRRLKRADERRKPPLIDEATQVEIH
jgi:hypothetical protein